MTLNDYLRGVPRDAAVAAVSAAARNIYDQHLRLLKELPNASPDELPIIKAELADLIGDARDILKLEVLRDHDLAKCSRVACLNINDEAVRLKLAKRESAIASARVATIERTLH